MRALAHPTRLALLDHLHTVEHATATECADAVGDSPSSCSYHLRALARWKFVEEAAGGVGRERPWRATASRIEFVSDGLESTVLRDELLARHQQRVRDALRREHELAPTELETLGERFEQLLDEFRGRGERRGTRRVVISFGAAAEPE